MGRERSPMAIYEKQARNLSAATDDIRAGVEAVTVSPTSLAIKAKDKMVQNFNASVSSGEWEAACAAVTVDEWKSKTLAKVDRVATGVLEAKDKIVEFQTQRQAFQATINAKLSTMPNRTAAEAEQRMLTQMREMRNFRYRRRAR